MAAQNGVAGMNEVSQELEMLEQRSKFDKYTLWAMVGRWARMI
jgi:hypothetical protein